MRVIGGEKRHFKLLAPEGKDTRPTADSIRETLFNMLRSSVPGSIFVDLFAGSGAIGIEALSRGAEKAYFFEQNPRAVKCIIENLKTTGYTEKVTVLRSDVIRTLSRIREEAVDLVYLDPPYDKGLYRPALCALSEAPFVTPFTLLIAESEKEEDFSFALSRGFRIIKEKTYKHNKHVFLQRGDRDADSNLPGQL